MTDKERLVEWFDSGHLVRPGGAEPGFIDLVRALGRLAGAPPRGPEDNVDHLASLIGPAEHLVFVLVDGMGCALLERAPAGGFLRTHRAARLKAVFPSTTAAALTTLATARWPADHAVLAWWLRLPRAGLSAVSLRFIERFSERPLSDFAVRPEEMFPVPSFWGGMTRAPLTVVPKKLAESVYTRYATAGTDRAGYEGLDEAMDLVAARVARAAEPTFTYLYLPQLDTVCHELGPEHPEAARLLGVLDGRLERLARTLNGRARLVVGADHGESQPAPERRFVLEPDDPLVATLECLPTGEPTVPMFHARPGCEDEVRRHVARLTGEAFALLTPAEAEELRLFGPGPLSLVARERLGTFLGVAGNPAALYSRHPDGSLKTHVGVHAGLSPEEMWVPLVLA